MTKVKGKRIRAKAGDIFTIPVAGDERMYGQVVDQAGPQFLVVLFRSNAGALEEVVRSGIVLAGIVFDAKLRNGDWQIVANIPAVEVKSPWFVVGHEGLENLRLESFDGSATRLVRPTEAAKHGHRHVSYPMVLQRAAEALRGHREWQEDLDFLRDLAAELEGGPGSN
jgi:hypothetical protein